MKIGANLESSAYAYFVKITQIFSKLLEHFTFQNFFCEYGRLHKNRKIKFIMIKIHVSAENENF
jgi:hypothetical protein